MRPPLRVVVAALLVAGCAPNVPPVVSPHGIEAFCSPKEARPTGMASVLTSIAGPIADPYPRFPEIRREVKAVQGAIGYWDDQLLLQPDLAKQFGEPSPYVRVEAIAIPTAPVADPAAGGSPTRRVYVEVKDHDVPRWIGMTAYDVQNVCVEGTRQQ